MLSVVSPCRNEAMFHDGVELSNNATKLIVQSAKPQSAALRIQGVTKEFHHVEKEPFIAKEFLGVTKSKLTTPISANGENNVLPGDIKPIPGQLWLLKTLAKRKDRINLKRAVCGNKPGHYTKEQVRLIFSVVLV